MPERDICEDCLNKKCSVRKPASADGFTMSCYIECAHYTCNLTGMLAARRAILRGDFEQIRLSDGTSVMAARFGTSQKPTQYPDSEFERLVTSDGKIITKTPDQEYVYTGQELSKRKVILPASSSN